jgi:hypothetical protein
MISSETLFDLDRLDAVVNTFIDDSYVDNVQTRDLVRLGQSLQGINAGRITFVTVPTTGIADADGNEVPRTQDVRALFDSIIDDEPLPGENDKNETLAPHPSTTKTSDAGETSSEWTSSETTTTTTTTTTEESTTTTTEEVKAVAADRRDPGIPPVRIRCPRAGLLLGLGRRDHHDRLLLAGQRAGRRHDRRDFAGRHHRAHHRIG